jgi:hypothetical protein
MNNCTVRFVDDERLALDWVLIEEQGGGFVFIVRRSAMCARVIAEGWAAYAKATARPVLVAV